MNLLQKQAKVWNQVSREDTFSNGAVALCHSRQVGDTEEGVSPLIHV